MDCWCLGTLRNSRSHSSRAAMTWLALGSFPGVFIRAPLVEDAGQTEVLAEHDGHPVAVRQGNIVALCFHPELSGDLRLHQQFLQIAGNGKPGT